MAFAWSGFLVTKVKLGLCLGILTLGMLFYTFAEIQDRRKRNGGFKLEKRPV
jgi:hypothetical protein